MNIIQRQKKFQKLSVIIWCWFVAVALYGTTHYPDAPFGTCKTGVGYCGKWGSPHSKTEFDRFLLWQNTLCVSGAFLFLGVLLANKGRK